MVENRRPHGDATARRSAGQMASQRKSVLAGNRKKQKRAQKRRAKQHAAPAFPANATQSAVHRPPTGQALAKCNNVYDNGTSATVVDTLASPLCSPCASTENGFEQSSFPLRRTNHFTKKNDSINDKALDAVPSTEMHKAILDARNVTHATFTADDLCALTRRELQALAKRFKVKANAKSSFIIDQLTSLSSSPCQNGTETEFEQFLPLISRTNHSAKEADKDDHKENKAATITAKNANATMGVPHIAITTTAARQALATRDDANVKAKPTNVIDTFNLLCSPCNSTETGFEQSIFPFRRTDHSTENDNTDDQACNATTAFDTHYATLDARNVTHRQAATRQARISPRSPPPAQAHRRRPCSSRRVREPSPPGGDQQPVRQHGDHVRAVFTPF